MTLNGKLAKVVVRAMDEAAARLRQHRFAYVRNPNSPAPKDPEDLRGKGIFCIDCGAAACESKPCRPARNIVPAEMPEGRGDEGAAV